VNIVQLPISNLNDIVTMARKFADAVEAGEYGEVRAVVVAFEAADGFTSFGWGDADDGFKVAGMFATAAHVHMTEMVG
jgi:hypothetical protein